jgi:DNA polymerase alpha subunit B
MDDTTTELTERFERYCDTNDHVLPNDVLSELHSMLSLYSLSAEELDFKWQAYSMKMGAEGERMELKTVRDFRKTMQDSLERESRGKAAQRTAEVKRERPTPRGKGADMYDMIEGLIPGTPARGVGSAVKRKGNFDTPSGRANKAHLMSSPAGGMTPRGDASAGP